MGITCGFDAVTCSFDAVTCSFDAVTCSFEAITFRFVIPKWWILQHVYSGGNSVEEVGGGAKLCEFPTNLFWFCIFFSNNHGNDKNDFLQTQRIRKLIV